MTVHITQVHRRPFAHCPELPKRLFRRALNLGRELLDYQPAIRRGQEKELVGRIRSLHSDLGLENWSDQELKAAIQKAKEVNRDGQRGLSSEVHLARVFAIVNEGIRRRLGAWRIFEYDQEKRDFARLNQVLGDIPVCAELEAEEKAILAATAQVQAAGSGYYGSDLLLNASFYRALRRADTDGHCRFDPTDQQLLAGIHLLSNKVVEMHAGEGKTIAIAFAAVMHSVLGQRVHIHTANDYLADRDCRLLAPLYRSLGLTVSVILEPMDEAERRAAYKCDIVYGTVREFGFDYLRDNLVSKAGEGVQSPLQVAIVDEADQALIDEGDTPLIIAGAPSKLPQPWQRVDQAVRELVNLQRALGREYTANAERLHPDSPAYGAQLCLALLADPFDEGARRNARLNQRSYRRGMNAAFPDGGDVPDVALTSELYYLVDEQRRFVTLTEKGLNLLTERLGDFCPHSNDAEQSGETEARLSRKTARRLQIANQVYQSLRAHLLLERNRDYVVNEDSVVILDKHTGRTKPDNLYRHGLQPALEAKEGVTINPDCESLAQISVQGFANRYRSLSGITGTALAASQEFQRRYHLEVVSVPLTNGSRRVDLPSHVYGSEAEKIAAVVEEVQLCRRFGRPALVGVQSINASHRISEALTRAGIEHRMLNAVNSDEEASIVRTSGRIGAVTVATSMAGRGTDIVLDPELDDALVRNWVRRIEEEIQAATSTLRILCYSSEEADVLSSALEQRPDLAIARSQARHQFFITVRRSGKSFGSNCPPSEGPEWEFGLGLHVINAEFSSFPRVAVQLKGRSGRQGLFGSSRQLLSWDDGSLLPLEHRKPKSQQCLDASDRAFHDGRAIESYIARRQDDAEQEAAIARSSAGDYAAVCDAHTASYYQSRREVLNGYELRERFPDIARAVAAQLVNSHFPGMDSSGYSARFQGLSEEARGRYEIDLSPFVGEPLDILPDLIRDKLQDKLDGIRTMVGNRRLESMARELLLECGDHQWREHLADLQQAVFSSVAGGHYHKSAVADYIIHARDMWEQFNESVEDAFCSRLLTFPPELLNRNLYESGKEAEVEQDLLALLT